MTNNLIRTMIGCAVTLCSVLTIYSICLASTQDQSLASGKYVIDSGQHLASTGSLNTVSPHSQTPTAWKTALVWIFGPLLVITSVLLIIGVLISSSVSLLPALPNVEATDASTPVLIKEPGVGGKRIFAPRIIRDPGIYKSAA
jgi:hypothetical protein